MTQRAKYIGAEYSLGFEKEKEYELLISIHQGLFWIRYHGVEAPYQSLKAFLKNWEPL
jgi:hypothetical protein